MNTKLIVTITKSTLMSCGLFLGVYSQGFAQVIYDSEAPECEVPEDGLIIASIQEAAINPDEARDILESSEAVYIVTEDFSKKTSQLNALLEIENLPIIVVGQNTPIAASLTAGWIKALADKVCGFFKKVPASSIRRVVRNTVKEAERDVRGIVKGCIERVRNSGHLDPRSPNLCREALLDVLLCLPFGLPLEASLLSYLCEDWAFAHCCNSH